MVTQGTGMYCTCGKTLVDVGLDNGMRQLVCPVHPKKSYRIPMGEVNKMEKGPNKSWFGSTVP